MTNNAQIAVSSLPQSIFRTGAPKQCEAAGAAISKGHLLLSHHFSGQQYLLKLYCMDTRLLLGIMDRNVDRFLAIRYTVLKAQNKISKQTYIA